MSLLDYLVGRLRRGVITFIHAVTLSHRDWPYHDFHTEATLEDYQTYRVGENNVGLNGDQHKLFVSKSTLIMATQDADVVFNHSNNAPILLLANNWYTFKSNIYQIHYARHETTGDIYIYCEGVLPQEARRPE